MNVTLISPTRGTEHSAALLPVSEILVYLCTVALSAKIQKSKCQSSKLIDCYYLDILSVIHYICLGVDEASGQLVRQKSQYNITTASQVRLI